jgi:ABC-type uncharacterized transport system YnjBCD ATPase subunit
LELPNVATSADPFGTVAGVQLPAVFQSVLVGSRFQVALPAKVKSEGRRKKAEESRVLSTIDRRGLWDFIPQLEAEKRFESKQKRTV